MLKLKLLLILLIFSTLELTARDSVDFAVYKTIAFNSKGDTFLAGRSLGYGFIIRISKDDKVSTKIYDLDESVGIQKIIFAENGNGWLVNGGVLYHSQDDGQTWVKQSFPIMRRIHAIEFDSNRGWVAGDEGEETFIYKTKDNGRFWEKLNLPKVFDIRKMRFINENKGWIFVFKGFQCQEKCLSFFKTEDGGITWTEFEPQDKVEENRFFYANNDEDKGKYFISKNFGEDVDEVKFRDGKIGFAISYYSSSNSAYFTKDGGRTWKNFSDKWKNKIFDETYKIRFPSKN